MCYDVKMDDTGEVLSGGKKRWKRISTKGQDRETTQDKTTAGAHSGQSQTRDPRVG
jgi:hypothetical protein